MGEQLRITEKLEEYLEMICKLEEKAGYARTMDLAKRLGVAPGSITNTIERLEKLGLVIHEPRKGVRLTDRGREIALGVIRRHRLSERLLTDVLRLEWAKVHEPACELEHSITDDISEAIERVTRNPKTCPHGNPIPTSDGRIIEVESIPLSSLNIGEGGTIVKVTEEDRKLLSYLSNLGIIPGAKIKVEEKAPFNGPIMIKVMGTGYAIGRNIASIIWIRKS